MRVIRTAAEMREVRRGISGVDGTVGLVATLGGIHVGHTTHMDTLRPLCDVLVGSLFLNPTQFGESEDLSTYPSNERADLAEFEKHGTDIVFAPSVDEMYPADEDVPDVDPGPVAGVLDGVHRPDHFGGVATVVARLFSIVDPDKASFGEKDAQQLRVIQHVNDSLGFGIEIIPIPTVREEDGLAVSSRNAYLSVEEREAATILFKALTVAKLSFDSGERSAEVLRFMLNSVLAGEPLAKVEYASIADVDTFQELEFVEYSARALLAVKIGNARLIDNFLLV
jgi:pantoate--beta-alanine ligase